MTMLTYQISYYFVSITVLLLSSLEMIYCVQIQPNFEVISIWNTDRKFVICTRDRKEFEGRVQWFGPDGRPVGIHHLSNIYQVEGVGHSKLFFEKPYKINSGVYVCRHTKNETLVTWDKFEMKIFNSIDMSDNIQQYIAVEGNDLPLQCLAKFDSETAEAQVKWIHESGQMTTELSRYKIDSQIVESGYYDKIIKSTMVISKVESDDAGLYMCQATYANTYLSEIKSIEIEVIVQYKPKFDDSPRKIIWLNEDQEQQNEFILEINCQARADPLAKFNWYIGNQSLLDNITSMPKFAEILTKDHLSILIIKLKSLSKFKFYIKELKTKQDSIHCTASNSYGNDSLIFDFEFGSPPNTPEIIYINFSKESGFIYLEINYTESEPPIDTFKLVLSKTYFVLFNNSHRIEPAKNAHLYKIPFDPTITIEFLDLFANNAVGWSRPLEMQDTTNLSANPDDEKYEWSMSNFQISVLLFIIFLLVASTAVQIIYFNYCAQNSEE